MGIVGTAVAVALRALFDAGLLFGAVTALLPRATIGEVRPALGTAIALACVLAGALAAVGFARDPVTRLALSVAATVGFGWTAWWRVFDARDREALKAAVQVGTLRRRVAR
jgi:hypothetical protein